MRKKSRKTYANSTPAERKAAQKRGRNARARERAATKQEEKDHERRKEFIRAYRDICKYYRCHMVGDHWMPIGVCVNNNKGKVVKDLDDLVKKTDSEKEIIQ